MQIYTNMFFKEKFHKDELTRFVVLVSLASQYQRMEGSVFHEVLSTFLIIQLPSQLVHSIKLYKLCVSVFQLCQLQ